MTAFFLPSVQELLISGGDERLKLNEFGINKYGCAPLGNDKIRSFSSSTASTPTQEDIKFAECYRQQLQNQLEQNTVEIVYQNAFNQLCHDWQTTLNLPSNTQVLLCASGTDLHHLVAQSIAQHSLILMVESNETGSGVQRALQLENNHVVEINLRLKTGALRHIEEIHHDFDKHLERAQKQNRSVLIIAVHASKTGIIAPHISYLADLNTRFNNVTVLIDACQFRLSPKTLFSYINQHFIVALTGSKFLAAPSFSGMLIFPEKFTPFFEKSSLSENNFGLLVRNAIALEHYQTFSMLSDEKITAFIQRFAQKIISFLENHIYFRYLQTLDFSKNTENWDELPTIFPFYLIKENRVLSHLETQSIYLKLRESTFFCEIGQPVFCGFDNNEKQTSVLRLCLSSRLIVQAVQNNQADKIIQDAIAVFNAIEYLIESNKIETSKN